MTSLVDNFHFFNRFTMGLFLSFLIHLVAVLVTAYLLPGVTIASAWVAAGVVIVLALINTLLRPIFVVLTLPFHILSFGLTLFVLNALIILLVDSLIDGFSVGGFWWALLFSVVMSAIAILISSLTTHK